MYMYCHAERERERERGEIDFAGLLVFSHFSVWILHPDNDEYVLKM